MWTESETGTRRRSDESIDGPNNLKWRWRVHSKTESNGRQTDVAFVRLIIGVQSMDSSKYDGG